MSNRFGLGKKQRTLTADALQRSCQQSAMPLQSAMQPLVEVYVGLAAACDADVAKTVAPSRAVPCSARSRPLAPLRCAHVSAQMQKCACVEHVQCSGIVFWSVHHGRARACARARVWLCVLCRCCRMGPAPPDAAHPVLTSGTEVQRSRASTHPPSEHCSRKFLKWCHSVQNR